MGRHQQTDLNKTPAACISCVATYGHETWTVSLPLKAKIWVLELTFYLYFFLGSINSMARRVKDADIMQDVKILVNWITNSIIDLEVKILWPCQEFRNNNDKGHGSLEEETGRIEWWGGHITSKTPWAWACMRRGRRNQLKVFCEAVKRVAFHYGPATWRNRSFERHVWGRSHAMKEIPLTVLHLGHRNVLQDTSSRRKPDI